MILGTDFLFALRVNADGTKFALGPFELPETRNAESA
jgi:hypothetical protein